MIFANATYLWGLLGLLIPIAIHMWSRKKVVTIKVGSTKLLQTSEPKQTSSIKINEWWLLFLRLLTIFLLTFILADPSIHQRENYAKINYIIEPSLIADDRMASILDTLPTESVRLLKKEFPVWDGSKDRVVEEIPSYWQLAHEMQTIAADSLVVFSKGFLKGLKGARPQIEANTKWISIESKIMAEEVVSVTLKNQLEVLSVFSDASLLSFKKDTIPVEDDSIEMNFTNDSVHIKSNGKSLLTKVKKKTSIRIGIVSKEIPSDEVKYLKAAYRAISKFLNRSIEVEIVKDFSSLEVTDFAMLVLLDGNVSKEENGRFLILKPDALSNQLIEQGPSKNIFYLTKSLNSENIVSERLPEKLMGLLELNEDLEDRVKESDQRVVAEKELQPMVEQNVKAPSQARLFKMTSWLWIVFILVLIVERILSKIRKQ